MKLQYIIDTVLSTELKALSFVDRYGSVVQTLTEQIDDGEGKNPSVKSYPVSCDVSDVDCNNTGFYQNLVPDDSKDSVVYWEIVTPMYNAGPTKINNFHTRKFKGVARLVVWMNVAKQGGADTKTPFFAIAPLEKILSKTVKLVGGDYDGSHLWIQPKGMVYQDVKSVFGKYTYPKLNAFSLYPYGFFAIDVNFEIDLCLAKGGTFPVLPPLDCPNDTGVTACEKLLASLTQEERNECILPTYDFSNTTTQAALLAQQVTDLSDWRLPLYDFSDPVTQGGTTATQQTDMQTWLCTPVVPVVQQTMNYNGVNEYLTVPSYPAFNFTNTDPFTIEIWLKPTIAATGTVFGKAESAGTFSGYRLDYNGGQLRFLIRGTSVPNLIDITTAEPITLNAWSHIIVKIDGSSTAAGVSIMSNNVLLTNVVATNALSTSTATTDPLTIGSLNGTLYFTGNIGYCRVWNKALNTAETTIQYNGGVMLDNADAAVNLVFENRRGVEAIKIVNKWAFPDVTGTTIVEQMSSANMDYSNRTTDIPT